MQLIIWMLLYALIAKAEGAFRSKHFEQLVEFRDKYVTSGILWNESVDSIYSCAISCQNDISCKSFFYGTNVCSGYDLYSPRIPDIKVENGIEFYQQTDKCDGNYTLVEEQMACYKTFESPKTWMEAKNTCDNDNAWLAIIDSGDKFEVFKKVVGNMCIGVFVPFINKCYWITSSVDLWGNSKISCQADGGNPASFPDVNTYLTVINEAGINGSSEDVWIGVNDMATENVYVNYDGSPLSFDTFIKNRGQSGKDMIAIIPTQGCTWQEREGALNDKYRMLCDKNINDEYWVGGSDIDVEGTWMWENGKGINASFFSASEPNGGTNENCAALRFSQSGTLLTSEDCSTPKKFLCEKF